MRCTKRTAIPIIPILAKATDRIGNAARLIQYLDSYNNTPVVEPCEPQTLLPCNDGTILKEKRLIILKYTTYQAFQEKVALAESARANKEALPVIYSNTNYQSLPLCLFLLYSIPCRYGYCPDRLKSCWHIYSAAVKLYPSEQLA